MEELLRADTLVIGVPTYNFNIPSTLKAWLDHVARAGTTFRYTGNGPAGLVTATRAFVFLASGGAYSRTDIDFAVQYLRHMLAFLGITEVSVTRAEGLATGQAARREAEETARQRIESLAA